MFSVIYKWFVEPEKFDDFRLVWSDTTELIHETVEGAMGSKLFRSASDERIVITIARWRSLAEWRSFWEDSSPSQMKGMNLLAEKVSVEVYEDIVDRTYST